MRGGENMRPMKPDKDICVKKIRIPAEKRHILALILSPKGNTQPKIGVLWLHGGGYILE